MITPPLSISASPVLSLIVPSAIVFLASSSRGAPRAPPGPMIGGAAVGVQVGVLLRGGVRPGGLGGGGDPPDGVSGKELFREGREVDPPASPVERLERRQLVPLEPEIAAEIVLENRKPLPVRDV